MKTKIITSVLLLTSYLLYSKSKNMKLKKIKALQKIRECDPLGCGYFGASRGSRDHKGIDIITTKGEPIMSPISGTVTRVAYPYAGDLKYKGLVIENDIYYVKMFYINPTIEIGSFVKEGAVVAVSQDIAEKYDSRMQTHVHLEMYMKTQSNGLKLIDPTHLF
jgi:murein DD-endopeptidase MepM/ murein hydrolase activator NlpD